MLKAQRQLADVDAQIQAEIGRVLSNLEAQARSARQRTAALREGLDRSRVSLTASNTAATHLAELESHAQADQGVYQSFLDRFKQTSAQQGVGQSDARVVSYARTPQTPTLPDLPVDLPLAIALALAAGVAAVALGAALEDGLYTAEDVERALGMALLAAIPELDTTFDRRRSDGTDPVAYMAQHPASSFAEAFRELRAALAHARADAPARLVAVTSALPGEGRTTVAIGLARALAKGGQQALVVDADLHGGDLARRLSRTATPGLLEVLDGRATLDEALLLDRSSGAWVLPLGSGVEGAILGDRLVGPGMGRPARAGARPLRRGAVRPRPDVALRRRPRHGCPLRRRPTAGALAPHALESRARRPAAGWRRPAPRVLGVALTRVDAREQGALGLWRRGLLRPILATPATHPQPERRRRIRGPAPPVRGRLRTSGRGPSVGRRRAARRAASRRWPPGRASRRR